MQSHNVVIRLRYSNVHDTLCKLCAKMQYAYWFPLLEVEKEGKLLY